MRWWVLLFISVSITTTIPSSATASFIQVPHMGPRDGGMAGNVVAAPSDGGSILLFNAAGVVGRPGTDITASILELPASGRYTNPKTGYDQKSSEMVLGPLLWVGTDRLAPWYVGAGIYGTVGSSFNFAAEPSVGAPGQYDEKFLAELGLIQCGLVAGREILPGLRFGLQVTPIWGRIRTKTPSPLGPVNFDVDGFGVSGATGLLYDLTDRTTLGISYRSPGVVYMRGGGAVAGQGEDVKIDFRLPQNVTFGLAHRLTPRLTVTAQSTWTDYPNFEKGVFKFEQHPILDQPFIARTRSTFRYGTGLEYAWGDWLWLRTGFTVEEWMIEPSAVTPFMYDASDYMVMIGLGVAHGAWMLDFNTGYAYMDDRLVTPAQQTNFPGRYRMEPAVGTTLGVTYRFGQGAI
jgi:hypothetical protein